MARASWATSPAVRRSMQGNRSSGTKPEALLLAAVRRLGLRPKANWKGAPGTPDLAWPRKRVAAFVDGDFWHGRLGLPRAHRAYWREKFRRNRARDRRVDRLLRASGWRVVRLWASDVVEDPLGAAWRVAFRMPR